MVAGAHLALAANGKVQVLELGEELEHVLFAHQGKIWAKATAQDSRGGFGNLHAKWGWGGDVFALVIWINTRLEESLFLKQLNLATHASLSLAEAFGDEFLLDLRVPFEHHQDFKLTEADAELFLKYLVGLLADNGC